MPKPSLKSKIMHAIDPALRLICLVERASRHYLLLWPTIRSAAFGLRLAKEKGKEDKRAYDSLLNIYRITTLAATYDYRLRTIGLSL
jgi:hypothetical protein